MKTVSLVLGSGGARGLAHIGVIHWLTEHGYQIKSISGCSSGAMVGGIYAAGKLPEFEEWVRTIDKRDVFSLMDLAWSKTGLVKGDRLINKLEEVVGSHLIEELPIKYTAVSVNLTKGREVWLNNGDLFEAIRASVAIPMLLTPVYQNGAMFVDGGVLNPVPVIPTFGDNTDLTIAVNLDADVPYQSPKTKKIEKPVEENEGFKAALSKFNRRIFGDSKDVTETKQDGFFSVMLQAFEVMQSTIARHKLAAYPPDHLIEISRHASKTMEVYKAAELIDLGYQKAEETMGHLEKK